MMYSVLIFQFFDLSFVFDTSMFNLFFLSI